MNPEQNARKSNTFATVSLAAAILAAVPPALSWATTGLPKLDFGGLTLAANYLGFYACLASPLVAVVAIAAGLVGVWQAGRAAYRAGRWRAWIGLLGGIVLLIIDVVIVLNTVVVN